MLNTAVTQMLETKLKSRRDMWLHGAMRKAWRTARQELLQETRSHSVLAVHWWRLLIIYLFWTCCLLKAKACQILGRFYFKSFCCLSKQVMSPSHPLHKQTFLQIIGGMEFIWQRCQFGRDRSLRVWRVLLCVCVCVQVFALHSSASSSCILYNDSVCVCVDFIPFGAAYLSDYTH